MGSATLDADDVRQEALGALHALLPFDAWSWATSDPTSHLATSAWAEHPFEDRMLGLLRAEDDPGAVSRDLMLLTTDGDFTHAAAHVPLRLWSRP